MEEYLIQGSESWKQKRRECITSTDIAKILNLNPYETALQCWNRKLGLLPDVVQNCAMRMGSEIEPIALSKFIKETGINFSPKVIFHSIDTWKMTSLDGVSDCGKYAVEIKGSKGLYEKTKKGFIDELYKCQVNWHMYLLNIPMIYFVAYWDGDYAVMEIKRDDDFLNEIMPKIHEFRIQLMNFTPPPATEKDFVLQDSKDWRIHAEVWKQTKAEIKLLEAKEECLRNELIAMCDGKSSQGAGIRISKTITKGRINYSNIKELDGIDLEKYRGKNVESFRFTEVRNESDK